MLHTLEMQYTLQKIRLFLQCFQFVHRCVFSLSLTLSHFFSTCLATLSNYHHCTCKRLSHKTTHCTHSFYLPRNACTTTPRNRLDQLITKRKELFAEIRKTKRKIRQKRIFVFFVSFLMVFRVAKFTRTPKRNFDEENRTHSEKKKRI